SQGRDRLAPLSDQLLGEELRFDRRVGVRNAPDRRVVDDSAPSPTRLRQIAQKPRETERADPETHDQDADRLLRGEMLRHAGSDVGRHHRDDEAEERERPAGDREEPDAGHEEELDGDEPEAEKKEDDFEDCRGGLGGPRDREEAAHEKDDEREEAANSGDRGSRHLELDQDAEAAGEDEEDAE